ncbi:hypothetical protein ATCVCan0610SP_703L [Acanthocystis turfacea Chlorella virus Can0610SP]|nr:hypothetical protein ATCVCan0610SP_703L [Acanthocystis turfacea Chlorella virus Can0610SP]
MRSVFPIILESFHYNVCALHFLNYILMHVPGQMTKCFVCFTSFLPLVIQMLIEIALLTTVLLAGAGIKFGRKRKTLEGKTIVFIRHGEKPASDLGQLSYRGLLRSLALPDVLIGRYGHASKIYAPNPSVTKEFKGEEYCYVRALAAIEPTAIRLGIPVNAKHGFEDVGVVAKKLFYSNHGIIFVCWEHVELVKMVKKLLLHCGADPRCVPDWKKTDYDSIYIVNISDDVRFFHEYQGLN